MYISSVITFFKQSCCKVPILLCDIVIVVSMRCCNNRKCVICQFVHRWKMSEKDDFGKHCRKRWTYLL